MADLEQRVNELETDVRIHFDIFSNRLDTMRAEGNLHHSELQLRLTSLLTTQTTILQLLHGIDERLRIIEGRNQPLNRCASMLSDFFNLRDQLKYHTLLYNLPELGNGCR